jgi:hypothetical protein
VVVPHPEICPSHHRHQNLPLGKALFSTWIFNVAKGDCYADPWLISFFRHNSIPIGFLGTHFQLLVLFSSQQSVSWSSYPEIWIHHQI